jgi:methylglutaconyl-CoA hydratase
MQNDAVLIEQIDRTVFKIILNRPEKHNALNLELMEALCKKIKDLENSACQIAIICGSGSNFCTGLDLKQASDEALVEKMGHQLAQLYRILYQTPLVTIAAVQGHAIAGGGGIAVSCDLVLFEAEAKIGFPEVHRGLVAAQVAAILARQMNMRQVYDLLLTGQLVGSEQAVKIGLCNAVVRIGKLQDEALRMAKEVLKGGPEALKETKSLLQKLSRDFVADLNLALSVHQKVRYSSEAKEGIAAFLEKRAAAWNQ